jgi:hypothetical protein
MDNLEELIAEIQRFVAVGFKCTSVVNPSFQS